MCVLIYLPCSQHLSSILSASILSSVPPRNILLSSSLLATVSYHLSLCAIFSYPLSLQSPVISPSRSSLLITLLAAVSYHLPFSQQSPSISPSRSSLLSFHLLATVSYYLPFSQQSPIFSPSRSSLLSSPPLAIMSVLLQRTLWSALCCSKTKRCCLHPHLYLCFVYFRVWGFPVRRNLGIRHIIIFLVLFCDEKSSH